VDDPLEDKGRLDDCVARVKISFGMKKIEKNGQLFGMQIAQSGDVLSDSVRGQTGIGPRVL
jgi:hypothetical protein